MHRTLAAAVLFLLGAAVAADSPPSYRIRLGGTIDGKQVVTFQVANLDAATLAKLKKLDWKPEQWHAVFAVYVGLDPKADRPPLLGTYRVTRDALVFEPRFPPLPGVKYRAVFDPSRLPGGGGPPITVAFGAPKPAGPVAVVSRVYPTRNKLPENQLKFYLHFSRPMSRGEAYRHIHLLDANGKPVHHPFLELGEELWDAEGKRFTLFFDPGRIKRGLKPREQFGPSIEEGKRYTLAIDRDWPDADGNPMKEGFRKEFSVTAPDDEPVDPKKWKLHPPAAGEMKPLAVAFPEPLDHALLHRFLWVTDADGKRVAGTITVTADETGWRFTPERPWAAGEYRLVADTRLEDLAGNRIGRPFEVDVLRKIDKEIKSETVAVRFTVR